MCSGSGGVSMVPEEMIPGLVTMMLVLVEMIGSIAGCGFGNSCWC